jgi:hypothetical protein
MDTHDTGRRQGTIQSQRQHGHTRHRSKARDNTEPETTWTHDLCRVCPCCLWLCIVPCLRPVSCVSMLSLALYCPLPSTCVVCVLAVSASVLSLSKARDNTEPETTWAHTTQVEGKGQYRARDNMETHDTGRRQRKIQNQRQHGHTRHRSKARDNIEPETTWTHTTCPLPSTCVVCVHVVSGSILSLAFDLCRVCPCCLWLCIVPCLRPVSCVSMLSLTTHDTGRRQGTIQSQRQHGHTRHRWKARDNIEPEITWLCRVCPCCLWLCIVPCLRPVSCVSMLSLALYCPLPSTFVVCVHVVSGSVLTPAYDLCRWTHTT